MRPESHPIPTVTQEAVIQVFAAPAVSWRGIFAVPRWIAVKPTGPSRFTRYEIVGFGAANSAPTVHIDRMGPDNYWFGARPQVLLDRRGAGVDGMIEPERLFGLCHGNSIEHTWRGQGSPRLMPLRQHLAKPQ
jgi:uncharacterized protein DUF3750